jgi:hypothetical protein
MATRMGFCVIERDQSWRALVKDTLKSLRCPSSL